MKFKRGDIIVDVKNPDFQVTLIREENGEWVCGRADEDDKYSKMSAKVFFKHIRQGHAVLINTDLRDEILKMDEEDIQEKLEVKNRLEAIE